MNKITVFGTTPTAIALAWILLQNQKRVCMFATQPATLQAQLSKTMISPQLLTTNLEVTNEFYVAAQASSLYLIATEVHEGLKIVEQIASTTAKKCQIINTVNGFSGQDSLLIYEQMEQILGPKLSAIVAIFGGLIPEELFLAKPTVLNVMGIDQYFCNDVIHLFNNHFLRLVYIEDIKGGSVLSAFKPILEFCFGLSNEYFASFNTNSALIAQLCYEIREFMLLVKAKPMTFMQFCGLGNFYLACANQNSQNYQFAKKLVATDPQTALHDFQNISCYRELKHVLRILNLTNRQQAAELPPKQLPLIKLLISVIEAKLPVTNLWEEVMKIAGFLPLDKNELYF